MAILPQCGIVSASSRSISAMAGYREATVASTDMTWRRCSPTVRRSDRMCCSGVEEVVAEVDAQLFPVPGDQVYQDLVHVPVVEDIKSDAGRLS